jgi:hypothetical protein
MSLCKLGFRSFTKQTWVSAHQMQIETNVHKNTGACEGKIQHYKIFLPQKWCWHRQKKKDGRRKQCELCVFAYIVFIFLWTVMVTWQVYHFCSVDTIARIVERLSDFWWSQILKASGICDDWCSCRKMFVVEWQYSKQDRELLITWVLLSDRSTYLGQLKISTDETASEMSLTKSCARMLIKRN